jgi:hypothetical protein
MLSDDVLLEIFDFYRQISQEASDSPWKWNTLIHVCQRWRDVVFGSPRRLDLMLLCTYGTPVKRSLDCWPSLPIVIKYWTTLEFRPPSFEDEDNMIAALKHHNRIRQIQLAVTSSLLGKVAASMKEPFPELTSLSLWFDKGYSNCSAPTLPLPDAYAFLCGNAPRLRDFSLIGIPFPDLPELLHSARGLASLRLLEVPETGYIAPGVMAKYLATLTHLKVLCVEFRSPKSCPVHERGIPPLALKERAVLPTLTCFNFRGASAYLEDLLARIEAPFLSHVNITFFNQLIFEVPHLSQFIGRMEMLKSAKVAEMESSFGSGVSLKLDRPSASATPGTLSTGTTVGEHHPLSLCVSCGVLDWQLSSMAQICSQSPLLSNVQHLDIRADYLQLGYQWQEDMDSIAWLELFSSFTSVETLSISGELCPHVAPALEVVATRMRVAALEAPFLPGLRVLHFECCRKSALVEKFAAARKDFDCDVEVQHVPFPPWGLWDCVPALDPTNRGQSSVR